MKTLLKLYLITFSCLIFAQKKLNNYKIINVLSEPYFFNGVVLENNLYFGTSEGVMLYNSNDGNVISKNPDLKGYITITDNKIVRGRINEDFDYNYLLPDQYKKSASSYLIHNSKLFITSRGNIFIYNYLDVNLESFASVRSISKNFIGTYEGIYDKVSGEKLKFPSYTNSYIRELDGVTFINWNGLSIIKDSIQTNFFNKQTLSTKINDTEMGIAHDVLHWFDENYIVSSSNGLYNLNLEDNNVKIKLAAKNGTYSFVKDEQYLNKVNRLFIHDNNSLYTYFPDTDKLVNLRSFNNKIIDILNVENDMCFVLLEDRLFTINLKDENKTYLIYEKLELSNNVGKFKNFIYVTSDFGLSLYDLNSSQFKHLVIKEEFNSKANFSNKDTLFLGSVNGLYKLNHSKLVELFNTSKYFKSGDKIILSKNYLIVTFIVLLIIFSVLFYFIAKIKKAKLAYAQNEIDSITVRKYIQNNLNTVTVKSICQHFNMPLNKLYSYMESQKPGEMITEERMKLLKRLRLNGENENLISKKTGFSISYLRQIKS